MMCCMFFIYCSLLLEVALFLRNQFVCVCQPVQQCTFHLSPFTWYLVSVLWLRRSEFQVPGYGVWSIEYRVSSTCDISSGASSLLASRFSSRIITPFEHKTNHPCVSRANHSRKSKWCSLTTSANRSLPETMQEYNSCCALILTGLWNGSRVVSL